MAGSVAAALVAVERGAALVRVHDVAETVDALKIWAAVRAADAPPPDAPGGPEGGGPAGR
jgi:dihydropteroate synthase